MAPATIDRDQLHALWALRRGFGDDAVHVVQVEANPAPAARPDRPNR